MSFGADYEKVEADFNPEMGFIRRRDNSHYSGAFSYSPRFDNSDLIRNLSLRTNFDYWEDLTGEIENSRTSGQPGYDVREQLVGDVVTNLVGFKVLYAFSSRTFLNTFIQYNADRNQLSTEHPFQHPFTIP